MRAEGERLLMKVTGFGRGDMIDPSFTQIPSSQYLLCIKLPACLEGRIVHCSCSSSDQTSNQEAQAAKGDFSVVLPSSSRPHCQAAWLSMSPSPHPLPPPKRLKMSPSLSHFQTFKPLTQPSLPTMSSMSVACPAASCSAGKDHTLAMVVLTSRSLSKPSLLSFSECIFLPLSLPKSWASCQHPFQAQVCSVILTEVDQENCSYNRYSRRGNRLTMTGKWILHTTLGSPFCFPVPFCFPPVIFSGL